MPEPLTIYALSLGGGTLALSGLPGRGGDFRGDLETIREWQPGIVVSMTTAEEMEQVGAANLGSEIQGLAARWFHLPVQDFSTPAGTSLAQWAVMSRQVRAALNGGGRAIVHCRAGCGRSGMAALRLMVEAGEERFEALNRLRALRHCAVETKAQLQWAFAGEPDPPEENRNPG